MTKIESLQPKFVNVIPATLESGILYISKKYKTASHLCCCGCGNKTVTPLKPGRWKLRVKLGRVSLTPSIGNWNFPCHAHYWVKNNQIVWADQWSEGEIHAARIHDQHDREKYFETLLKEGFWQKVFRNIFK